ncbi:Ig domain-containing protein [Candidatus Undinarchaeota archaeon]
MRTAFLFLLIPIIMVSGCTGGNELAINATDVPQWTNGQQGSFQLEASGGTGPYTWAATGLPEGFAMNANGVITGVYVLASGTSKTVSPPFTVTVTDSTGKATSLEMSLTITEPPPELLPVTGAICYVDVRCEVQVANAQGGTPPYTFQADTFREGAPPMGMTIGTDGVLMGTPTEAGAYVFGICVKDTIALSDCGKTTVTVEEEQPLIAETWTGTFGGTSEQNAHCVEGEFTYTFSVSFEYPMSLVDVLRGELELPWELWPDSGAMGTASASAVATKNVQTSKYYPDCRLIGGSYADEPLAVDASEGKLGLSVPTYGVSIVPESYIRFTEDSDPTKADYGSLILDIEEISDTTVSGTWGSGNYISPGGQFTLTKS